MPRFASGLALALAVLAVATTPAMSFLPRTAAASGRLAAARAAGFVGARATCKLFGLGKMCGVSVLLDRRRRLHTRSRAIPK